jgi:hypothetical protein
VTDRPQLAAYIAAVLKDETGGMSCSAIARRLGMRDGDVRAVLRADPWFVRVGTTRGARWQLVAARAGMGRNGTGSELLDVLGDVLRRLAAAEARLDALERRNGDRA